MSGSISVVSESDQLRALRAQWHELLEGSLRPSVFLSHEWFESAWQWRQKSARLHFLCYHSEGKLGAVCPLVGRSQGRVRLLEFLTVPDTQLCDLIVTREHQDRAIDAFVSELAARRRQWDVLRLQHMPPDAIAIRGLLPGLAQRGFRSIDRAATANPYIALDGRWDAYYATRTRSLKKASNLAANRLNKAGKVVIKQLAAGDGGAEEVERFVSQAITVSARSWKGRTENSLDHAGPQAFIRMLSDLAHQRGWLSIWLAYLDGEPIAMEYQLVADGNVYALRSDFDGRHQLVSPGSYLSRHLLERLFGCALRRYLMGPGQNSYKYRWTDQAEPLHEGVVFSSTLGGTALAAWTLKIKPVLRHWRLRFKSFPTRSTK